MPGTAKRQLKITLPAWLDDAVRELWETQAITFSELIDDILGDEPHQLTPDEARQWRRSQRLAHRARKRQLGGAATGTPHRTLLVAPGHLARLDKAAAASGVARSTLLAVLLARHPTVAEAADEPGPPDNPTEAGVDSG